jgi:hypothetical protein
MPERTESQHSEASPQHQRIEQRAGLLELHDHNGRPLWISPNLVSSIRSVFPKENQSIITVAGAPVELQVDHSPDELLEALESVRVKP